MPLKAGSAMNNERYGDNMVRKIIKIDEEKCNGCGACAAACQEGAIKMEGGKAVLAREDYCDGLGNCLPACPTNAISFEEREAPAFDEAAALAAKQNAAPSVLPCGCPGTQSKSIERETVAADGPSGLSVSRLRQWPVQLRLVPENAPYFNGADLLVAADCTAYAYGNFHNDFINGRIVLIGCPKLDEGDYTLKLARIMANNDIKSVTVARMEVPCCGGIERAVKNAINISGSAALCSVAVISTDGKILS